MTRQIEMNFYADNVAKEDQKSIAGDLFDVSMDTASKSMHLKNSTNNSKTVSINATVPETTDSLFND